MSRSRMARKAQTLAAAAALGAGGLLVAPAAHAADCAVDGDYLHITSGGRSISVEAHDSSLGPGVVMIVPGDQGLYGKVIGKITGKTVDFTVNWDESTPGFNGTKVGPGLQNRFSGDVKDDGFAKGDSTGSTIPMGWYAPGEWHSTDMINCAQLGGGGTTVQKNVTVKRESDVYDAISGNRIEAPFFLTVDRELQPVQPCADNWCLLTIPDLPGDAHGGLPAKQGWVYAGEGFLQVP